MDTDSNSEYERIKEQRYEEMLEDEILNLRWRKEHDPEFTPHMLQVLLDTQYFHQDEGWCGRGDLAHLDGTAKLAAMEIVLHEWKKELEQK